MPRSWPIWSWCAAIVACAVRTEVCIPSILILVLPPRVRSVQICIIIPTRSFVGTSKMSGQICTFEKQMAKRLQKNCIECTRAHRRCVFLSKDDVICTRCNKFRLSCQFRYSGMFNIFFILIIKTSFLLTHQFILFSFLHITEQGRRHDLKNINSRIMKTSDDTCIVPPPLDVSSDSVHCNALTQSSAVSYAFSCHTTDSCFEDNADDY